jgi:hypothetical protein
MVGLVLNAAAQDCAESLERNSMLLATPENIDKCKDIPNLFALNTRTGEYFPATPPNFSRLKILAVKVCKWVDPISGEDIIAQIPAEEN